MKGWVGHGHPECLIEHEAICRVQRPGSEQAGAAFRARQDGYTDVPGGDRTTRELRQLSGADVLQRSPGRQGKESAECLMWGSRVPRALPARGSLNSLFLLFCFFFFFSSWKQGLAEL